MTPRLSWNNPLIVSTTALLLVAGYFLTAATGIVGAVFSGGSRSTSATETVATLIAQHDEDQETYLKRYDGRSPFFIPRKTYHPPTPTIPTPSIPRPTQPENPKPVIPHQPPPPQKYGGPPPIAFVGNTVWFRQSGQKEPLMIAIGEEKEGIKVLSIHSPYTVRVAYTRSEYEVELFTPGLSTLIPAPLEEIKKDEVKSSETPDPLAAKKANPTSPKIKPGGDPFSSSGKTTSPRPTSPRKTGLSPASPAPAGNAKTAPPTKKPIPPKKSSSPSGSPKPADPDRPPPPLEPVDG